MLAQVSAGQASVLDDQSSGIDGLPAGSCKSLVRLIGLRKYVGIMLLPALGHADAVICLQSYLRIKSRGS
jgi:hypothetical protein